MNLGSIFSGRRRPRPPRPQTIISRQIGKGIAALILAGGAALFGLSKSKDVSTTPSSKTTTAQVQVANTDENYIVTNAINQNKQLTFVEIKNAKVIKLLRNDNKGARHQRWIIQLSNGTTMTVVHNIDLAQKVPLSAGDSIDLAGELIYGDRKGDPILHWTHDDPQKKRVAGYVLHMGKKYGELF